jgi:hypothetical protein
MFPRWSPYPTEAVHTPALKTIDAFFDSDDSTITITEKEKKIMRVDAYNQWTNLVKAYSKCEFTHPDDRLMAMAGIAEMFKKNTSDQYLAGLWKSRLVEGLGWVVLNPISRPKNPFRVPSWSWAAVDSAILPQGIMGTVTNLVHVIDASVEHSRTSAGCEQIKGSIQLRGCISKATVFESNRSSGGENVILRLMETSSKVFAYPDTLATTFDVGKELHFIPLRSTMRIKETSQMPLTLIEGLMLEAVSGVENTFRRIGQFVIFPFHHGSFFGLITTPSKSCEEVASVKLEEAQKSIVTLV